MRQKFISFIIASTGALSALLAQPALPTSAPNQAPIGGLGLLAAAGGALAAKKLLEKRKK